MRWECRKTQAGTDAEVGCIGRIQVRLRKGAATAASFDMEPDARVAEMSPYFSPDGRALAVRIEGEDSGSSAGAEFSEVALYPVP